MLAVYKMAFNTNFRTTGKIILNKYSIFPVPHYRKNNLCLEQ